MNFEQQLLLVLISGAIGFLGGIISSLLVSYISKRGKIKIFTQTASFDFKSVLITKDKAVKYRISCDYVLILDVFNSSNVNKIMNDIRLIVEYKIANKNYYLLFNIPLISQLANVPGKTTNGIFEEEKERKFYINSNIDLRNYNNYKFFIGYKNENNKLIKKNFTVDLDQISYNDYTKVTLATIKSIL